MSLGKESMHRLVVSPLWCLLTLGIAQSLLAETPPISTASAGQAGPTFSDGNWISMNPGVPGADGPVSAAVVDGSGNLNIGGLFTIVGNVIASHIAKWDGSSWTPLGSGMNGSVDFASGLDHQFSRGRRQRAELCHQSHFQPSEVFPLNSVISRIKVRN
jgi:hypothetical protein